MTHRLRVKRVGQVRFQSEDDYRLVLKFLDAETRGLMLVAYARKVQEAMRSVRMDPELPGSFVEREQ